MNQNPFLILLVGSNPLPNYLAACALKPSRVALVHTAETTESKDRLRDVLKTTLGDGITFDEPCIADATDATSVCRVIEPLVERQNGSDVHLNYTGGTKVMAVHARMAFQKAGGKPEHASYLDEGGRSNQPRLRFDDGTSKPLSNIDLTLANLLALHGITHKPREAKDPAPTIDDAKEILCKVLANLSLARVLYDNEFVRLKEFDKPNKAIIAPFRANSHGLELSLPEFPTEAQLGQLKNGDAKKSWFAQWYKFIGGEWLEEWVGHQIQSLELAPVPEITTGVQSFRGEEKAQFEIDVAVIRRQRSYFISCTTDTTKDRCKSKLFEIAVRSRQLGGDLARAAVVCLADHATVAALQKDINDLWGASNTTRVFGLDDIRTWSDCNDKQPNLSSLKEWLES